MVNDFEVVAVNELVLVGKGVEVTIVCKHNRCDCVCCRDRYFCRRLDSDRSRTTFPG